MNLAQLRNNKRSTLLKYISINYSDRYILENLPSVRSGWLDRMSAYHPGIANYIFGKYYDCQNKLSNHKRRIEITRRPQKMSRYKEQLSFDHVNGYEKLSKFKK